MKLAKRLYRKIKRPSFSRDFGFIIMAVVALVLICAVWFSMYLYQNQSEVNNAVLKSVSKKIERTIIDDFDYVKYQMEYITNQIRQKGDDPKSVNNILGSFKLDTKTDVAISWNMFSWMSQSKYITVDGTEGVLRRPIDLSGRDYIPHTIKEPGELKIGAPVHGAVSRQWIIPVGMGVVDKRGNYLGSIVFGFHISNLVYKLESIVNVEGIKFALLNLEDDIIAKSSGFDANEIDFAKVLTKRNSNKIISNKKTTFFSIYKMDSYPVQVLVYYDPLFSNYKFWHEWSFYMMQFLIALVFIVALLWIIKVRIITPIGSLSDIAKLVSKGNIDVDIPKYKIVEASNLSKALRNIKNYIANEIALKNQLKLAEIRASKANDSKTKFLQSTSHDLKNYIASIYGVASLLLNNRDNKSKEDIEDIELIAKQAEEMMYFVDDLLDTNQTESGEFSLGKIEEHDIEDLINRMVLLNKSLAIKHDVTIETALDSNLPSLKCDIRRMKQILTNLLTNAIKYSNAKGVVRIAVKYLENKEKIKIEISDQGIGMSQEDIKLALAGEADKIDKSILDKQVDSHGIGMPIVKRLVELHKGELKINSKPGEGTIVTIVFQASPSLYHKEGRNILIVDDEKTILAMTKKFLERNLEEFSFDVAKNGEEAVKLARENKYDLIIMDIEMPVMDGIEATKEIRKFDHEIPIVAYSSLRDMKRNVLAAGMNDYLHKLKPNERLLRMVCKWAIVEYDYLGRQSLDRVKEIVEGKKVILADDELTGRMILSRYLGNFGIKVDGVDDGEELFKTFLENSNYYDLILTDLNMPGESGAEITKKIRKYQEESDNVKAIPIIAYSGDSDKEKLRYLLECGMDDYFIKGGSIDSLVRLIAFWVKNY